MRGKSGNKSRKTVFSLLVRPILLTLILLVLTYTVMVDQNVLSYLKTNAVTVFEGQVLSQSISISNEMVNRWSRIQENVESIVKNIETTVKEQGAEISDIHTDAKLNQAILDAVMGDIIGTLRTSGVTEIFLILNGNAVVSDSEDTLKAGVYLRNSNPEFYSDDNQDLLFERGVPAISKKWRIPLDSYWETGFKISDKSDSDNFFYTKPFEAASASDNKEFQNFAYWNCSHPINDLDRCVLSYSVPLITSGGEVIGVMGVGVNVDYFKSFINHLEQDAGITNNYFLAKTQDGVHFEPMIFSGNSYNKNDFLGNTVEIRPEKDGLLKFLYLDGKTESRTCAGVQYIQLYDSNTPFEQEQWALVGIQQEEQLKEAYNSASMMLFMLAFGSVAVAFIGVFLSSRFVARSLRRLMEDLRGSDTNKPIRLQRLNVEEIDELINAIENLSARVAASSSKISTILQMAESGIGVCEYLKSNKKVFCSRSFYEICQWEPIIDTNEYIDSTLFLQRMSELEENQVTQEDNLYELTTADGNKKWIRLNRVEDEESVIGVVTDVTASVLEKHQIEYERDYDILTNLYNRRAFSEHVQQLSELPDKNLRVVALVMWDMDNLKYVNDAYGHHMGDIYITEFANCLNKYQSHQVISARRSGDEFYTIFFGFDERCEIEEKLRYIWNDIQRAEITLPDGQNLRIRVSAGVSWYPENSENLSDLFKYSDFAMYSVKHNRKGEIGNFDAEAYHDDWYLAQGQGDFNILLDSRMVRYAAQPILAAADGSIYGYEMLMRSQMESFQSPMDILKMARAQSRLYDIEVMTWLESLRTFKSLRERRLLQKESKIFINSIANQLIKKEMQELIEKNFEEYLHLIVCEFTEEEQGSSDITEKKHSMIQKWNGLVALDDYGCGYNSETILLAINPDIIKIDMEFVRGIDTDENKQDLVKGLVVYAHEREILVLGEGIETAEELETLIFLGIDLLQGYYIAKPTFDGTPPADKVCREIVELWRRYRQKEEE